ncbi:hypothetical protein A2368_03395 [Candidatus Collierbacteria bacterium RIFOXYB1_FULL_49_13]|uniref:Pseudouridine synthase n=1 Tax=Candidatus Collierbacteria bacterium RIFOXYB1_FULL_49_13 TaxID=1817728 RepID=A0A1F5FJB4_9BACT|nr:MAG: hypothetical protein A2368_03395 [Candidatus Collierbacteria bacterium RIFOXYB1_FULL_49_13]
MKIIFEDEFLLVVDKPAGMVVNRAESVESETVQDWVEDRFQDSGVRYQEDELFKKRSGIAHRLDKETSGCLVVAKTPVVLKELMRQFKDREVEKQYVALVHGKLEPLSGSIRLPIARSQKNRKQRMVYFEGKTAESRWTVDRYINGGEFSLVSIWPKTGRTHQIRVHMKFLGHTIVGDKLYASENEKKRDELVANRHLLHAKGISFTHPVTKEILRVESELADDFKAVIERE